MLAKRRVTLTLHLVAPGEPSVSRSASGEEFYLFVRGLRVIHHAFYHLRDVFRFGRVRCSPRQKNLVDAFGDETRGLSSRRQEHELRPRSRVRP